MRLKYRSCGMPVCLLLPIIIVIIVCLLSEKTHRPDSPSPCACVSDLWSPGHLLEEVVPWGPQRFGHDSSHGSVRPSDDAAFLFAVHSFNSIFSSKYTQRVWENGRKSNKNLSLFLLNWFQSRGGSQQTVSIQARPNPDRVVSLQNSQNNFFITITFL